MKGFDLYQVAKHLFARQFNKNLPSEKGLLAVAILNATKKLALVVDSWIAVCWWKNLAESVNEPPTSEPFLRWLLASVVSMLRSKVMLQRLMLFLGVSGIQPLIGLQWKKYFVVHSVLNTRDSLSIFRFLDLLILQKGSQIKVKKWREIMCPFEPNTPHSRSNLI